MKVFRFAADQGWLRGSPAARIKPPRVALKPTLPFAEEVARSLAACDRFQGSGRQLGALALLIRHSGLRIRDAVTLGRDRIRDGPLFLNNRETGTPVCVPSPPGVLEGLEAFEPVSESHHFGMGRSDPDIVARAWSNKLRKVFLRAGLPHGREHRLRDTLAARLLERARGDGGGERAVRSPVDPGDGPALRAVG